VSGGGPIDWFNEFVSLEVHLLYIHIYGVYECVCV
jgi:hypothetical protein